MLKYKNGKLKKYPKIAKKPTNEIINPTVIDFFLKFSASFNIEKDKKEIKEKQIIVVGAIGENKIKINFDKIK
jgi:hypothetical protein